MKIYLAGPEVFFPDPVAEANKKKHYLAQLGHDGVFPLDNSLDLAALDSKRQQGMAIAYANIGLMMESAAIIANLSPWHGPSADIGTILEVAFMAKQGKPIAVYSTADAPFEERVRSHLERYHPGGEFRSGEDGLTYGPDGFSIEEFGLDDNLMLPAFLEMWSVPLERSFEEAADRLNHLFPGTAPTP